MTQDKPDIINDYPPNYAQIVEALGDVSLSLPVFAYAPNIYNPFGRELLPDVIAHELVHIRQQNAIGVEVWYNKYCYDASFRLSQEIEAYAFQYNYAKSKGVRGELLTWLGEHLATELSGSAYGSLISFHGALTAIRKHGRE